MNKRRTIPIFPLPSLVFLPETELPLHIFEPRYCAMVAEAWAGERIIGMTLLAPGWEEAPEPRPILDVGCAGEIISLDELEDGRFDIVLEGLYRFRVAEEIPHFPYRIAHVLEDPLTRVASARSRRARLVASLDRLVSSKAPLAKLELEDALSDEGVINQVAVQLGVSSEEGYELLTMPTVDERYDWVQRHLDSLQAKLDFLAPYRPLEPKPELN